MINNNYNSIQFNIDPSKTAIILVNDGFHLGGIEILELKIAKRLVELGYRVYLLHAASGFAATDLDGVGCVGHNGMSDLFRNYELLYRPDIEKTILASFHPKSALASLILASRLQRKYKIDIALFHLVSHSRAFFFGKNPVTLFVLKTAFAAFPRSSCFFMNDAARDCHQGHWHTDLTHYPVLRIIGRDTDVKKVDYRQERRLRIVSVGRLVPFKTYNIHSPRIIRELVDAGVDATWDIWGYGPDLEAIAAAIWKYGVADRIQIKGPLDHCRFDATVVDYDLFVGMGTAALEAAKLGVPTVVAIENAQDNCYGFLPNVPGDSVGDRVEGYCEKPLFDTIIEFVHMSPCERKHLGDACISGARDRESKLDEFVEKLIKSPIVFRFKMAVRYWLEICGLYLAFDQWRLK